MIVAVKGLLAVTLLAGAYLVVSVLVLFYLTMPVLCVWSISEGTFNPSYVFLTISGGFMIIAMLRAMAEASGRNAELPNGVMLSREQAPNLWELVDNLASQTGTKAPAELWLTGEANAAVSEDSRGLGLLGGLRRMEIGAPLLVGLPTDELRAVLCHELGHYARGHTRLGPVVYRGSVALVNARRNIARAALTNNIVRMYAGIPLYLLSGYAWLYNGISLAVRRRQELDADAVAVRIAGRNATAGALRSAESLAVAWADFHTRFLEPMRRRGREPDDPFRAFQAMLDDPDYRDVLARLRQQPPRCAAIGDSHPSLADRLARIERLPDTAVDRYPAYSRGLLPNSKQLFRRLQRRPRTLKAMPWRDWLSSVTEHHTAAQLEVLRKAVNHVHRLSDDTLRPGVVLHVLEAGHSARLATALAARQPDVVAEERIQLYEAVFTLVGQALVQAGSASWTVPWTGTCRLITRGTTPAEIQDLVRTAVDKPTEVHRIHEDLAASQVDVDQPLILPCDRPTDPRNSDSGDAAMPYDDEELVAQRRSSFKVILALAIPIAGIAAVIALMSNSDDQPHYPPTPYQPPMTAPRSATQPTSTRRSPHRPQFPRSRLPQCPCRLPCPSSNSARELLRGRI